MPERFSWVADLARGEWLRPMEAEDFASIPSVVPAGFEAYARVFHPVERDRPRDTKSWQGVDETTYVHRFEDLEAALETEQTTWATAAASFGTTMHAEAQYARLVRRDNGETEHAVASDGWRYSPPLEGCLEAASLSALSVVLARHTSTPDAGIAAIWEGWGGLVSSAGRARFWFASSDGVPARYSEEAAVHSTGPSLPGRLVSAVRRGIVRARSVTMARPAAFRAEPELGSGLLAREIAAGPRFDLHGGTGRSYVLFEAGADDFADIGWPERAPWVDEVMCAQSPSIVWPDDHAWVLATEIDFDSTLVAGSRALIDELLQAARVEVLPIRADANLTWDGDLINRPE